MNDGILMRAELKKIVQPFLRTDGFQGSFPNYRRISINFVDLLTFQFDKWGGGFVVEIARCPSAGLVTHWGKHIQPKLACAHDVHPNFRKRVSPEGETGWFRFNESSVSVVVLDCLKTLQRDDLWSNVKVGQAALKN